MVKANTTKVDFPLTLTEESLEWLLQQLGLRPCVDDPRHRALDLVATHWAVPFRWACHGVYRLQVVDEMSPYHGMEYVGMSNNVRKRVASHISTCPDSDQPWGGYGSDRPNLLRRHMEARALSLFPNGISRRDLAFVEYHWIELLKPALNGPTPRPQRYGHKHVKA